MRADLIGPDGLGCDVKRFIGSGIRNLKEGAYFGKSRGKIVLKNWGHNGLCSLAF